MKNFYITTTLPYVNADPHIGFALEIIQADVLARYHRLLGEEVIFNTGTDEHGLKIWRKAEEQGIDPQTYCDDYAAKFGKLKLALNLSYTNFIRTTNPEHKAAAQEFWGRCLANGDIYKKEYQVKYCVGCELEKTDSELVDGRCPVHPNLELELINEENYFFRFSKYQKQLLDLYKEHTDFVVPAHRLEEIKKFVERGLEDFSISRLKSKMPWGVAVPGDNEQVMYVWFDALINYISTLGWPNNDENFEKFWPGVQVAGKDNLRQQSAMWQAMLLSADLSNSKQIFIHGFVTANGQKMSKSLGNVINPIELVQKYGVDAVRYYLLGAIPAHEDGDFSEERFKEFYTAHLANGIGNLTSRVLTMIEKYSVGRVPAQASDVFDTVNFWKNYQVSLRAYQFDETIRLINDFVSRVDGFISVEKPWEKFKNGIEIKPQLYQTAEALFHLGLALLPIIPASAEKILKALHVEVEPNIDHLTAWGNLTEGAILEKIEPLFPRL